MKFLILFQIITLSICTKFLNIQSTNKLNTHSKKVLVSDIPIQIDITKQRQQIEGFGASNAWISYGITLLTPSIQNQLFEALFSTTSGLGLTIVRNRIPPKLLDSAGNWKFDDWDLKSTAKMMKIIGPKYNVTKMFSTPWTPPAFMKNNSNEVQGTLSHSSYQDYANYLTQYTIGMKKYYNLDIYAVSIQNEPNWKPTYESCWWTAENFNDFIANYLCPAFEKNKVTSKLMMPESFDFNEKLILPSFFSYTIFYCL